MQISKILNGPSDDGIERMAAFFRGHAFSPHRHDTYAIGLTSVGVQAFTYRGETQHCMPGQAFVLHPDEKHDGRPGDDRGFGYRVAYIDPALLLTASGAGGLPFMRAPVSSDAQLTDAIEEVMQAQEGDANDVALTSSLVRLADVMSGLSGIVRAKAVRVHLPGVEAARDVLIGRGVAHVSMGELEAISGLSRWELARQFRAAYGVSPHRFHLLRRLGVARGMLMQSGPLADIALSCGFADQAHLTRHFKSAFGLSPGRWRALSEAKA
ncbi:MAG: AraC family transcriptional regulator [Hyphomicrobiaceae bacterium]